MTVSTPHHTVVPWAQAPRKPVALEVPGDLWALNKQIDELGGEWTYNLFVPRTYNFHMSEMPVEFYESFDGFNQVAYEAAISNRARQFRLPEYEIGSTLVDYLAYPSLFNPVGGFVPMPAPDEVCIGRHAARIVGLSDGDTLVIRHAWSGWTEDGTAQMSKEFFDSYAKGTMMMRRWDRGPLANTADELLNTSDPQRFRQLWREARSPANVRNGDKPWRSMNLSSFSTWSSNAKVPVELLTLQTYAGVRVGVAILFHLNRESSIRELFIWPPYRRKGLGSLLERFAIERATAAGSIRIKAYVSEADSIRGLTRATAFLESREYNVRYIEDDDYIVEANRDIS